MTPIPETATARSTPAGSALPVAVDIADAVLAVEVTRHIEAALGWQAVLDSPDLPVRLRLTDDPRAAAGAVIIQRDPGVEDIRGALASGALDILGWPGDADRLPALVPERTPLPRVAALAVRGSAGGVGASTVALAVASVYAWSGRPTWLVADPRARRMADCQQLRPIATCAVVPALRIVGLLSDLQSRAANGDTVVIDGGSTVRGQVLVSRPDADLAIAMRSARPRLVVVVGTGGLRPDEVDRVVGSTPIVRLSHDIRVARAALRRRLPGAFPGRLLADVRDGLLLAGLLATGADVPQQGQVVA